MKVLYFVGAYIVATIVASVFVLPLSLLPKSMHFEYPVIALIVGVIALVTAIYAGIKFYKGCVAITSVAKEHGKNTQQNDQHRVAKEHTVQLIDSRPRRIPPQRS